MKENGVSAVVGVMLLLALTIIIAAVLSAFAGGVADETKTVPSADLDVYTSGSGDRFLLVFEHKGGDILQFSDVKITTLLKNPDDEDWTGSFLLSELGTGIWEPGEIVTTSDISKTATMLGVTEKQLKDALNLSTPVDIRIYHIPTSTIIYRSTILLEEK